MREVAAKISPFEFSTLKQFPLSWTAVLTVLMTVLCFCGVWHWYEKTVDMSFFVDGSSLGHFVHSVRNHIAEPPEILIGGTSQTGMGIERDVLTQKLHLTAGKVSIGSCWIWEVEHILKKYQSETKNVKIAIVDLNKNLLENDLAKGHFRSGASFHFLKNCLDFSQENICLITELYKSKRFNNDNIFLPLKFSLRNIKDINEIKDKKGDYFEAIWTNHNNDYWNNKSKATKQSLADYKKRGSPYIESHIKNYLSEMENRVWQFVNYCHSRNIFVVFTIPPTPSSFPSYLPEGKNLTDSDHRFIGLCGALDNHTNCKVTYLKNFTLIRPEDDEAEYLFDYAHQTKKGATVYAVLVY